MHRFFIKTHPLVRWFFRHYVWRFSRREPAVYLTFDDGPHPTITPWVLDQLKQYKANATFFCVGENVARYNSVYQRIIAEGHAVGNHSHTHPNGWQTPVDAYIADVQQAATHIQSHLFRPPYGRITKKQAAGVRGVLGAQTKIIMWDVLSCDFDPQFSKEKCVQNVLRHARAGSIVVFHDSEKAAPNLKHALPAALAHFAGQKLAFKPISQVERL